MTHKGKFRPKNLKKYFGKVDSITYRSSWEKKFMIYCDNNPSIVQWASEEVVIAYKSPLDNKIHRYYPDFYLKVKQKDNSYKNIIVEIKPLKQCSPPKIPKRKTIHYLNEVKTWAVNEAKWKAAKEWCADRKFEFKIITEKELKV